MGDYFADKWAALSNLPAAIAENPLFFALAFLIGLPLIWWKWRAIGNSNKHAIESASHGLRTSADSKTIAHDTGIGTQDVLVMRPPAITKMVYFALLFFGGGALFFWLVVLPSPDATSKDWWAFAGMVMFTIGAMFVIELSQTRIVVGKTAIEKRRVLHKRQHITVSDISGIEPLGHSLARGARLHASDGQVMRIGANFSGYRDLILRLKGITDA
jgi:hypothetical protein